MPSPSWIKIKEILVFVRVAVWSLGLRPFMGSFDLFRTRIERLIHLNGRTFVCQYLKECFRLVVRWAANAYAPNGNIGVSCVRGLPRIIPAQIRLAMIQWKTEDSLSGFAVIRCVLTVLSLYRVIGVKAPVNLGTIISPFKGVYQTMDSNVISAIASWLKVGLVIKPVSLFISESSGPNYKQAIWGSPLDAVAFLFNPFTWFNFAMCCYLSGNLWFLCWQVGIVMGSLPLLPLLWIIGLCPVWLGKLAVIKEGAGKNRIVALTDYWTQAICLPLHNAIFKILKSIKQDGTFDQHAPVSLLHDRILTSGAWSFDLSAATDRLPVLLQCQVLTILGLSWAKYWMGLLAFRQWAWKGKGIMYAVGQPMGAYSSWAMLALTHHFVVQYAAYSCGWRQWFPWYAIVGDDLVIADEAVALSYKSLMSDLGLDINMSKSLISSYCYEFAKRWVHVLKGEFTPIGAGVLLVTIRNLRLMPLLFLDMLSKHCVIASPAVLERILHIIGSLRPKKSSDIINSVVLAICGPSGIMFGFSPVISAFALEIWLMNVKLHLLGSAKLVAVVEEFFTNLQLANKQRSLEVAENRYDHLLSNWWRYTLFAPFMVRLSRFLPSWQWTHILDFQFPFWLLAVLSWPLLVYGPSMRAYLDKWRSLVTEPYYTYFEEWGPYIWISPWQRDPPGPWVLLDYFRTIGTTNDPSFASISFEDRDRVLDLFAQQNALSKVIIQEANSAYDFYRYESQKMRIVLYNPKVAGKPVLGVSSKAA